MCTYMYLVSVLESRSLLCVAIHLPRSRLCAHPRLQAVIMHISIGIPAPLCYLIGDGSNKSAEMRLSYLKTRTGQLATLTSFQLFASSGKEYHSRLLGQCHCRRLLRVFSIYFNGMDSYTLSVGHPYISFLVG